MKINLSNSASKYRMLIGVVGVCLIMVYQNCAQSGFQALTNDVQSDVSSLGGKGGPQALDACQTVTPNVLQSRIRNLLGIAAGDVPVLNDDGSMTSMNRIASELSSLGVGDPSNGIPNDFSCSTPKFKDSIEIMIDACTLGLQKTSVQNMLFPNGSSDYTALYQAFIGRVPTDDEISILSQLTSGLGAQAEPAACAAVASSLESLVSI